MTSERIAELRANRWNCSGTSTYARAIEECLDEIERLQAIRRIPGQRLAEAMVKFALVDSSAIDSPEDYDNYATLEAINAAAKDLSGDHET